MDRKVIDVSSLSLFLSLSLTIYLPTHLSIYVSIYLSLSVSLSVCLSIALSIYLSVCLSSYLAIYPSICLSIYLSLYLCICLFIFLSIHLSIYRSIYRSIDLSIYRSTYLSINPSTYVFIYPSIYLSIFLSIYLSLYLCICLFIFLSIHLSIYLSLSIYPSTYLFIIIYLSIYIYLSICLSICLSVYLSFSLSIYLSVCLSIYLSLCLSIYLPVYLQAWKRSYSARRPQVSNLTTSKTEQFCEISSMFELDNVKNEAILRDVFIFQSWRNQKRSNSARLPPSSFKLNTLVFLTFWLGNVLRATKACTFSTSQLPKVVRTWGVSVTNVLRATTACTFSTSRNFQKWSENGVLCTFWLQNVLRATTACNFSSLIWPDGSAPAALASLLFDPAEPQIIWKTQCFATFLPFRASASSFFWFCLFSDLLSSTLLSDSSHLCFSSAHIVGSLTSKLPSISYIPGCWLLSYHTHTRTYTYGRTSCNYAYI